MAVLWATPQPANNVSLLYMLAIEGSAARSNLRALSSPPSFTPHSKLKSISSPRMSPLKGLAVHYFSSLFAPCRPLTPHPATPTQSPVIDSGSRSKQDPPSLHLSHCCARQNSKTRQRPAPFRTELIHPQVSFFFAERANSSKALQVLYMSWYRFSPFLTAPPHPSYPLPVSLHRFLSLFYCFSPLLSFISLSHSLLPSPYFFLSFVS